MSLISAEGTFDLEQGVNRGDIDDVFGSNHTIGPGEKRMYIIKILGRSSMRFTNPYLTEFM